MSDGFLVELTLNEGGGDVPEYLSAYAVTSIFYLRRYCAPTCRLYSIYGNKPKETPFGMLSHGG